MKKEEILEVVRSNEGTVLSFPDRGPWGITNIVEIAAVIFMHS